VAKHVTLEHQLADFLTKPPSRTRVNFICEKLGLYNIYVVIRTAPTTNCWGGAVKATHDR